MTKHIHQYKKKNMAGPGKQYWVYACFLVGCRHYIPVHMIERKESLCNQCLQPMVVIKELIADEPICETCILENEEKLNQIILAKVGRL